MNPADRQVALPTAPFLVATWAPAVAAGGGWMGVSLAVGRPMAEAVLGLVAAGIVGLSATGSLLVIAPSRPKPLRSWPMIWLGGSFMRLMVVLGLTLLLYSATRFGAERALWFATIVAYLAVLVAETRVYAVLMNRAAPPPATAHPSE